MKKKINGLLIKGSMLLIIFIITVTGKITAQKAGNYASVNGLKMYYEIHGQGKPLVLLHGAFNTIGLAFGQLIPELSKSRKVIAVELQGHGRTADIDRPFSFEAMADDVAALLKQLKEDSADILGYSMGGATAIQLVIRHPQVVRKMIVISAAYKYEGWSPETRAILPMLSPEMFEGTPLKTDYDSLAPDPKNWTKFVNKMKQFVTTPFDFKKKKSNRSNRRHLLSALMVMVFCLSMRCNYGVYLAVNTW